MPTQAWRAEDFAGLTPAVDPRRSNKLYPVGGRNYVFDSHGPKSIFGNRMLLPHPLKKAAHAQGARLKLRHGDRIFTFEGECILEWQEDLGGWRVLYITPDTSIAPYRWTYGYLNGWMYFCHPRVGIVRYNIETGLISRLTGPGVPSDPLAITINNGRLVVLDDVYLSWSWQSDGSNFTPALGQAGFQQVSDRVSGFPVMLSNYAKGVLTWTTGGVMRSEFTGDSEVYRHRNLNTEYRPINSFCTLQTDENTCVILDERGLFQTQGEQPQPMAPLFNEFLISYIQENNLKIGQNIRIEWDDLQRFMYISVSLSQTDPIYERAFVLYPPLDKWGVFNEPHHGILPLTITDSERADDYYGFVDQKGVVRYWFQTGSRESTPTQAGLDLYYPLVQKQDFQYPEGIDGLIVSSSMVMHSFNDVLYDQRAGYYPRDGQTPAPPALVGLDAKVQIGLIRFDELRDSNDQMTELTQVGIGNVRSGTIDRLSEDFNLIPSGVSDEDYLSGVGGEDLGTEVLNYINHGIRLISTTDGEQLFCESLPELVLFNKAMRYYSCCTVGVWHILELTAGEVGEMFHLRVFELTGTYAGRLL